MQYRKPPVVRVSTNAEAMATTGIVYWLEVRVPLVSGQPAEGVPLDDHDEGLDLALRLADQLPPGPRREAQRLIEAAVKRGGRSR